MPGAKRVLITGGRNFRDKNVLFNAMNALDRSYGFTHLIHGGASGADTLAGIWASECGVEVCVYPADWDKFGRAAGRERNQRMLNDGKPDLVVAFPGGRGTADMVMRARHADIPVIEPLSVNLSVSLPVLPSHDHSVERE